MNLQQAISQINSLENAIPEIIKKAEVVAIQRAYAEMLQRIFNEGKNSGEESLGHYSLKWAKVRTKKGRQTVYKDLEFTGKLRRSIIIGEKNGSIVIGILKQGYKSKADTVSVSQFLEQQGKTDIFSLSKEELVTAKESGKTYLIREISKFL